MAEQLPLPVELIERRIYLIRGHKVMLDSGLAELYQVSTKVLNQGVKRNLGRFPEDFMFRLTSQEAEVLNRSQFVTGFVGGSPHVPSSRQTNLNRHALGNTQASHKSPFPAPVLFPLSRKKHL